MGVGMLEMLMVLVWLALVIGVTGYVLVGIHRIWHYSKEQVALQKKILAEISSLKDQSN